MDYRRGTVSTHLALSAKASPWAQDLCKALILNIKGEKDKAIEILEKWTKKP